MSTKIQVDTFILLLFCCLFGVYAMRFISVVVLKVIVFTPVIYATTVYHQSERNIPIFVLLDSCCNLGRFIPTWFQVIGHIGMHIYVFEENRTSVCFGQACPSCTFPWIILGLSEQKYKSTCTSAWMS